MLDGLGDGGVHPEAQDVHLDQAERLDVVLVELRHDDALGGPLQRHEVGEALAGDDEAAQVHAEVGGEAGQALGEVDEARVLRVLELVVGELGALGDHLGETPRVAPGDALGEAVDLVGGVAEGLGDDAHRRGGAHRVDGGHHGHLVVAEALVDEGDDLVAALGVEVDVDVGHLAPGGVEEALEEQVVGDGIGVGDAQHVAHDAVAGRASPRVEDAARAGELDDVVHGEEVLREAELLDDLELAVEAVEHLGRERVVALLGAGKAAFAEEREGGLAGRQGVGGEEEPAEAEVEVAARRDALGVAVGLGVAAEEAPHLARRLEEELSVPASEGIWEGLVGGLGGEHVVQRRVDLGDVVDVVGGYGGESELVGQQVELAQQLVGVGQKLVLELDVEVVRSEGRGEDGGGTAGAGAIALEEEGGDLAAAAGREGDEVVGVLLDGGEAGERLFAGMLEVGGADDAAEVGPAGGVLGEEDQVEAAGGLGGKRGGGDGGCGLEVLDGVDGVGVGLSVIGRGPRRGGRGGGLERAASPPSGRVFVAAFRASLDPRPALRACAAIVNLALRTPIGRPGGGRDSGARRLRRRVTSIGRPPTQFVNLAVDDRRGAAGSVVVKTGNRGVLSWIGWFAVGVEHRLDCQLDADDRLDASLLAGLVEAHRPVESLVVGDRERLHAQRACRIDELVDAARAVAEREVGVDVKMNEPHEDLPERMS